MPTIKEVKHVRLGKAAKDHLDGQSEREYLMDKLGCDAATLDDMYSFKMIKLASDSPVVKAAEKAASDYVSAVTGIIKASKALTDGEKALYSRAVEIAAIPLRSPLGFSEQSEAHVQINKLERAPSAEPTVSKSDDDVEIVDGL